METVSRYGREPSLYLAFLQLGILSNVDNASIAHTLKLLEVLFLIVVTAEDVKSYKLGLSLFEEAVRRLTAAGIQKVESCTLHQASITT
jgi:hypothetical protein